MYVLIVMVYLMIGVPELVSLSKKNQKKEVWIYSIFIGFAFVMSIALAAGVDLPRPMEMIDTAVSSLGLTNK